MKKTLFVFVAILFLSISAPAFASTIKVDLKVNGQSDSVAIQKGDVIDVSWAAEGSEMIKGCKGTGLYGLYLADGREWVEAPLPTSGNAKVTIQDWTTGATGFSVYCWLGDWPQNAKFGENVALDEVILMSKPITPIGPQPVIFSLIPSSGPVGSKVQIVGSGFTTNSDIAFVGSMGPVSGASMDTVSPINGELHYKNVNSPDGKNLTFVVPSQFPSQASEKGIVYSKEVVPGIYYIVVQTDSGKSGVSYFKVTSVGEKPGFISPTTSRVVNQNLTLRDLGPEVSNLQGLLSKDPSIYPERLITGYFGSLTQKAVQRFQCKHGIVCSGDAESTGYGSVDLKTRLKIEEAFSEANVSSPSANAPAPIVSQSAQDLKNKIADLVKQIQQLQEQIRLLSQ